MAVVVMRAFGRLHLLLQRGERLLRLADIAGLQGVTNLAEGATALARRDLCKRGVGALRGRQIAGPQCGDELTEALPVRILDGRGW